MKDWHVQTLGETWNEESCEACTRLDAQWLPVAKLDAPHIPEVATGIRNCQVRNLRRHAQEEIIDALDVTGCGW